MATDIGTQQPQRIWLLTAPRTASHLLVRMLNLEQQDKCQAGGFYGGYFFLNSSNLKSNLLNKPFKDWTGEEMKSWQTQAQVDFDKFQDHNDAAAQNGKIAIAKEHNILLNNPYYESLQTLGPEAVEGMKPVMLNIRGVEGSRSQHNLTVVPDEYLESMTPVFLIRHPAAQIPSLYRSMAKSPPPAGRCDNKPTATDVTWKFARALYEFYASRDPGQKGPPVVDADDMMTRPELVKELASRIGLDPQMVLFSWAKKTEKELAELHPGVRAMLATLDESSGVVLDKVVGDIDIEQEVGKWRAEFGDDEGKEIEKRVRDSLADYQYLRSKRLTVD